MVIATVKFLGGDFIMSTFTDLFAEISDTIIIDKIFITYDKGHYILHQVKNGVSGKVETVDGADCVMSSIGSMFIYNGSEWVGALDSSVSDFISHKVTPNNIVYSSYDIYKGDEVYYYGASSSYAVALTGSVSSSMILNNLKQEVLPVVPLVAFAVIAYIGFRKAWNFLCGGVRGA